MLKQYNLKLPVNDKLIFLKVTPLVYISTPSVPYGPDVNFFHRVKEVMCVGSNDRSFNHGVAMPDPRFTNKTQLNDLEDRYLR